MGNKTERNGLTRTLPKLLRFKRTAKKANVAALKSLQGKHSPADYVKILNGDDAASVSAIGRRKNGNSRDRTDSPDSNQKRNGFHLDAEEAVNSLLWQPYEYRDAGAGLRSPSSSTSGGPSSSSSSSTTVWSVCSGDLERIAECTSFTDPHLPTPPRMVNNPRALPTPADRPVAGSQSRDAPPPPARSLSHRRRPPSRRFSSSGAARGRASSDDNRNGNGDMHQVNVSTSGGGGGSRSFFHDDDNLSSANVVGLPNHRHQHARFASAPVGCARPVGGGAHSRSSSVPDDAAAPPPLPQNVSNVNVDFYRAVPVNVVSAVPTIRCLNEVSHVQVLPLGSPDPPPRTFTSTEAQTDEIATDEEAASSSRRRRERRQQRRSGAAGGLPDLLNSHQPPPYPQSPLRLPPPPGALLQTTVVPGSVGTRGGFVFQAGAGPQGPHPAAAGFRLPFPVAGFSRGRFPEDHPPKGCCGLLSWKPGSLRWFIALIALVAVCCVLVGTALGAMRPSGRDHLTVSLLMIGVGIVLVTVSGVAWRLTSRSSASSCRSMLGLGGGPADASDASADGCARRFAPRLPPPYGRPHHPYAAMMYPEFQYRPPPPSYQASMQEYRLRLLLLDRVGGGAGRVAGETVASPPPTYRSHAGSLLRLPLSGGRRDACQSEYSCPPSYRSRPGSPRRGGGAATPPLGASESSANVVRILGDDDAVTPDSFKTGEQPEPNAGRLLPDKGGGNLVTIVQTDDRTPVIVTVSGGSARAGGGRAAEVPPDIEILAHL